MSSPKTPPRTRSHEEVEDPAVRPEDGPIEPVSHYFSPMYRDTDSDSSYSKSTGVTDTESLKSSIMEYKWVHGRRFHAYGDGTYCHELFRIVHGGKLYQAPIGKSPQNILDVGCGTGIWAISDMADLHPSAEVVGVDLSPIQPNFVPLNCRFEVDDINKEWTYAENKFDFIHIRYMTGTVPNWKELLEKAQRHLKPGGWIEHVELWGNAMADDGTMAEDSPLKTWVQVFEQIGEKIGNPFFWDPAEAFQEAGLQNISERKVKVPIGTWPKNKDLKQWGAWNRQFLLQGLEGFSIRGLTELLGWEYEKAQVFLVDMRKEILNPSLHSYVLVTAVWGQKPLE
ncbi:demethylmenaquinone methyltransferase [Fusarium sporotrichioides]|uniref:Demethylmenaquinone methyltransferase n=1 Tax=Fusarium sporotrichioides TaxID=5514 RepID=A0A395SBF5_FUSSP|nr:demethylmenaquinone methyltransferase [Fusarium sporotrichioides]